MQTRAGVVGYPNVGKSSLINRLLKRKICAVASRPGVTRELKWVRIGQDLDILDSPGILPMRFNDQAPAIKLAICDDIGERSYAVADVAAILIEILKQHPNAGAGVHQNRYKINADCCSGEIYVKALAQHLFNGDVTQAAFRILYDFRKGKFGQIALERPPFVMNLTIKATENLKLYLGILSNNWHSYQGRFGSNPGAYLEVFVVKILHKL